MFMYIKEKYKISNFLERKKKNKKNFTFCQEDVNCSSLGDLSFDLTDALCSLKEEEAYKS